MVVSKGMGETEDAYSAFQARDAAGVWLGTLLERVGVRHLYVMGLATDYCVKASALDGLGMKRCRNRLIMKSAGGSRTNALHGT